MRNTFGQVKKMNRLGNAKVRSDRFPSFHFNPECLELVDKKKTDMSNPTQRTSGGFKKGDRVKLKNLSVDEMKQLQKGSGGYKNLMSIVSVEV